MKRIFLLALSLILVLSSIVQAESPRFSASLTETYASGWVPPTTWKHVYSNNVLQSEFAVECKTDFVWPKVIRFTVWAQNSIEEKNWFTPPAAEMDYAVELKGSVPGGFILGTEVRLIDLNGPHGVIGHFGDCDLFRLRFKLDRPINFGRDFTLTPSVIWFHVEPIGVKPRNPGDSICFLLNEEWRPLKWFKVNTYGGYLHDGGLNNGSPADVFSCGASVCFRLPVKTEIWLQGSAQTYTTLGTPRTRPDKNFNLFSAGLCLKF